MRGRHFMFEPWKTIDSYDSIHFFVSLFICAGTTIHSTCMLKTDHILSNFDNQTRNTLMLLPGRMVEAKKEASKFEQQENAPINHANVQQQQQQQQQQQRQRKRNNVKFHEIHLRLYSITLGDNPSATRGPPIQLDWKPLEHLVYALDEFEANHNTKRTTEFRLTSTARYDLLKEGGFSNTEVSRARRSAALARIRRQETIDGLYRAKREEQQEEFVAHLKRVFLCQTEPVLEYPTLHSGQQHTPVGDDRQKVKPMFDNIPCAICSKRYCVEGTESLPAANVRMFQCRGKSNHTQ